MTIHTPHDVGALIRERRKILGWDQRTLAQKAGASRQWLVAIEQGKPGAAIGLILRTLQALGVSLAVQDIDRPKTGKSRFSGLPPVDINKIVFSLRKKKI